MKNELITHKDYYRITNCSGDFRIPEFTIEEVQQFLIARGYAVIIHKAMANVEYGHWNHDMEYEKTGNKEEIRERILAVRLEDENMLPDRVDSPEAVAMDFRNVFNREMKAMLLGLPNQSRQVQEISRGLPNQFGY